MSIAHQGNCNGVDICWRVYPTPPSSSSAQAYSSGTTSAYAYLLGEDAFGIDMIKNWSHATWTHNADSVLTVSSYQVFWGTTHKIHVLGLYLGDGWTVEYNTWGKTRHGGGRVEAWSIGYFHVRLPGLPYPRAQTRRELHAGAKGAFYCEFTLRWINNYAFTSESECSRN